jgi:uncharacterized protein DUF6134
MPYRLVKLALVLAISVGALGRPAIANTTTAMFAVMRNDDRIGTNTIKTEDDGKETVVETITHVAVKLFFVTVYHFDQTETERWSNGHFVAMNSSTNDNGKVHTASAASAGDCVVVDGDGIKNRITSPIFPGSLWNPAVLGQSQVLNPNDGHVMAMKITDRGEDDINLNGHAVRARHYEIKSAFSQEAWYDAQHQLVKVQLRAPDGSTVQYLRL